MNVCEKGGGKEGDLQVITYCWIEKEIFDMVACIVVDVIVGISFEFLYTLTLDRFLEKEGFGLDDDKKPTSSRRLHDAYSFAGRRKKMFE